ncbi:hypothetical protein HPB58_09990 [Priestia filamentosa]|uniref:polymorphic toxin type 44 domain-containing protein n=1 Tax=Priestia filamentosa TaxID=1402861 RepID=UPI001FB3941C|nr:polymorphic toxin type 44 domain-containing protein [Priestia filamentosa]UOE62477.1 hypothetical protein HPB58_09990 [Priestia filamentosa]
MKKVIAPLLTCSLLVTIPSFTFAEETISNQAQVSLTETQDKELQDILDRENLDKESQALVKQKVEETLERGEEIFKERDKKIQQAKASQPQFSIMGQSPGDFTHVVVRNYFEENLKFAKEVKKYYEEVKATDDPITARVYRDYIWVEMVKTGAPWDLKKDLGRKNTYYFNGTIRTGEFIGNAHFGYMGRAIGYDTEFLKFGAGAYQIYSGTSDLAYFTSYFDDPKDTEAIGYGAALYDSGKTFTR